MSNGSRAAVNRAVATIRRATGTDATKVSVTNDVSQAMQQSASWGAATDVQTAVKAWTAGAAAIDANAKAIANLQSQLRTAEAKQQGLRRDWVAARNQVTSAVTAFCGGSADMVKTFDLDVVTRSALGPLPAPAALSVNPGKGLGEVVSKWEKGISRHGFIVQHATDPTNAATVSAGVPSTKPTLTLGGLPQGANVSFRVAAIDPASSTGMSPWSAWVIGNAR